MVSARFGRDMPQPIANGIYWRVYRAKPDSSGSFRPVKEDKSATPTFVLPPGDYVVHAVLGLVSAVKVVQLRSDPMREVFDLPAGGLRLEGKVGDVRIPAGQINFDVFQGSQFEPGDRRPIAQGVMTGDVIVVPEGTYYIVSNYGDANAVVRSDIRVQVGKLTDVTVNHRAAVITLKLVSGEGGGGALANTAWSVLSPSGDVIKESTGAFPRVILAEGDYRVIARNEGALYQRDFKVIAGVDGEVEVVAHGN
jgi:nucleoside phosphorylase